MLITMPSEKYRVVQSGDSLFRISNRVGILGDVPGRINGIHGPHISVGQKLRLNS
jgi:LysM repeat protein